MKTIFIINPKAGRGRAEKLVDAAYKAINETGASGEVYITKGVGDAKIFTETYCKTNGPARFIACGGDGTLNEVLNGMIGFPDAELGVIPMGTGNDFCRNFSPDCDFQNMKKQITADSVACDAIRYNISQNGEEHVGFCANMFNIGFDCNVADLTAEMKKRPFIFGPLAYFISIFVMLIQKKGADLSVCLDGVERHNGKLLLTSIANGSYCGGGVKSNPAAQVTDGQINVNIVKNLSRLRFISLLPFYMKGTIMNCRGVDKYITTQSCQSIVVTPAGGVMRLCVDGEIIDAGETRFDIVPGAFRFVVPRS